MIIIPQSTRKSFKLLQNKWQILIEKVFLQEIIELWVIKQMIFNIFYRVVLYYLKFIDEFSNQNQLVRYLNPLVVNKIFPHLQMKA